MTTIDAVLFDLGGVVLNIDFGRAFSHWAELGGISAQAIRSRYSTDEAYRQHERGEIDAAAYFRHLRRVLQLELSDSQFVAGWNRIIVSPIPEMPDLLAKLSRVAPSFAFSNTNAVHAEHMRIQYRQLFESFRKVFVSSELGSRKPEPAAFLKVAELMKLEPERILFFDDLAENVDAARQVGMYAVQVASVEDVRGGIQRFGLPG